MENNFSDNFSDELLYQRKILEDDELRDQLKALGNKEFVNWLNNFILFPRPWRAVIGNKKCHPIPLCSSRYPLFGKRSNLILPENIYVLENTLKDLGFVVSTELYLSVPKYQKGETMTFAQKCVKIINRNYSLYVEDERKKALEYCNDIISFLNNDINSSSNNNFTSSLNDDIISPFISMTNEHIVMYPDYTLFMGYEFDAEISKECSRFLKSFLLQNGIEQFFDSGGNYLGLRVLKH